MTGVFNKRPPQPRCLFVWDVQQVLKYLKNLPENNLLTDKQLTLKVMILLALTAASRVSETSYLNTDYFVKHENFFIFHFKVCRPGKQRPPVKFHKFAEDDKLCFDSLFE